MHDAIRHAFEEQSNVLREAISRTEPRALRTYTPTQAVIARSAGVLHWTPEGRQLYDFTSGVLVANLGHNPRSWLQGVFRHMGWDRLPLSAPPDADESAAGEHFFEALALNAYNAVTPVEALATQRLLECMRQRPGGRRMERVLWAASGSEAIQKALWAALARDRSREMIIATRFGFHGKKGLAGAVSGHENDHDRDPRVRFITFPQSECSDVTQRDEPFEAAKYLDELEALKSQFGRRLGVLITEPYLGSAGSYHPPLPYLKVVQQFCRDNDIIFILDEVQANFGRTGRLFAYETYELEPDIVVLGKGLGNGVPVSAAVGRADLFAALDYGEGSDTWSANPLCCAGVLATLDEFDRADVLAAAREVSALIEAGLLRLKQLPVVRHVRGERGGMVWGLEFRDHAGRTAADWANAAVLACYRGRDNQGVHLLGPLAQKVLRIAPPLVITKAQAEAALDLMYDAIDQLVPEERHRLGGTLLAAR